MKKLALAAALALSATVVNAAPITAVVSSTNNGYRGSLTLLNDGIFPAQGSAANGATTVSWNGNGADKGFKFAFDGRYLLEDIRLSVDANDQYRLDYSLDDVNWLPLFTVFASYGEITSGMDTMSTVLGDPDYVAQIDFSPVAASFVRITADDGVKPYAIGEVAFSGTRVVQPPSSAAAIPEPGVLALLATALGAGVLIRRRGIQKS